MLKKEKIIGLFLLFFLSVAWVYAQDEVKNATKPLVEQKTVSIEGRITLEKQGKEEQLILHAKNAKTYLVLGELKDKLKTSLLELGQGNVVLLEGNLDDGDHLSCRHSSQYEYDKEGNPVLNRDVQCIRYYHFIAKQILFAKKSDEEIPPPERDTEAEKKAKDEARRLERLMQPPPIIGEIYGKIKSINLKSPVKTIVIVNRNKASERKEMTLMLMANTKIAKKIGDTEPIWLMAEALKAGQEVTAMYSRTELKTEALAITITKE